MRRRLALLVAATTSLVLVAFLVPLALLVRSVAADRAVSDATLQAQSLSSVVSTADRDSLTLAVQQVNVTSRHPVTVFLPDGTVIGAPAGASPGVELARRGSSVTVSAPAGREILVSVDGAPGGTAVVRTYVSDAELHHGVARAWLILGMLGLGLLLVGLLVADRLASALVRPISALAAVSHRLAGGELTARTRPVGPPEIRAVGEALNHLAGRIRELLHQERERVADLSHRLRTPLTALRLETESLRDPDEAARVGAKVDVVERAVSQAISDARRPAGGGGCDAAAVVREQVGFWSVLAEDQDRRVDIDVPAAPLPARPSREELASCVDALIGNVFAHTPDGTAFAVRLAARPGGGARLVVADEGPGFGDRDPLPRGVSGAGSTGLGLDIARRVAESSGGGLTLGVSPSGGAQVEVDLRGPAEPWPPAS
ncbi:MAG TPA: HAMP domain-containing sensor histidine kinase [Streptosporangiaceae bacterium]|jgi:signal transduction histidine kinase